MRVWRNRVNQSQVALEWLNWCDHELRQQALDQLTHEDLEANDMMARAYPDHPHPSQRHYIQHVDNGGEYLPRGNNFTVREDTNTKPWINPPTKTWKLTT